MFYMGSEKLILGDASKKKKNYRKIFHLMNQIGRQHLSVRHQNQKQKTFRTTHLL